MSGRQSPGRAGGVTPAGCLVHVGAGALNGEPEMQDIEQSIRERAYQLWTEDGCPDGDAEHWLRGAARTLEYRARRNRSRHHC
jgi:hypothetical protein